MSGSQHRVSKAQIHQFNSIGAPKIPRSTFLRSYPRRMTMGVNKLVPMMVDEILPGDDLHLRATVFARLSTPIFPFMDNLYYETFTFFCPNRLVWDNWEKFQGAPINDPTYSVPTLPIGDTPPGSESYLDYFGANPYVTVPTLGLNCLWLRAMALIYREWFRDENLEPYYDIYTGDTNPSEETLKWSDALFTRNKRKDYVTACLPWPQKGTAAGLVGSLTGLSIESKVPGSYFSADGYNLSDAFGASWALNVDTSGGSQNPGNKTLKVRNTVAAGAANPEFPLQQNAHVSFDAVAGGLRVEADDVELGLTINQLRLAAITQQILELDARGGTRYTEALYSRFGVISPDARLQRPELVGTGHSKITVYAVPQTSESGNTPQGNLAAFGTMQSDGDHRASYAATEHGMLIMLANVRADLTYQQKIPRYLTRVSRLDYYEPMMNGLGEQAVFNYEVHAGHASPLGVWGYIGRFDEYRYRDAEIVGKFRSDDPQSLDPWHLSQDLAPTVALNSTFIRDATPIERVVAVENEPPLLVDIQFDYRHTRAMPMRSNPGITRL